MRLYREKYTGFSLIELMVVVGIIGILASIAVPSFNAYVESGRRAEAKAYALDIASRQERHFTQFSQYANNLVDTGVATNDNLRVPQLTSENSNYVAVITRPNGTTSYLIEVQPAGTTPVDITCGNLRLTNTGQRGVSKSTDATVISNCWR